MKTQPTDVDPRTWLEAVTPDRRRSEGLELLDLFTQVTGWSPMMWGDSIVGFGRYDYTYESGRSGSFLATGFSPRKSALSIYVIPGYAGFEELLSRLGPHKTGRACLYVTRLDKIDRDVLSELIEAGLEDLASRWSVSPR